MVVVEEEDVLGHAQMETEERSCEFWSKALVLKYDMPRLR